MEGTDMLRNAVLLSIKDKEASENIMEIIKCFVEKLKPVKIFLFGSFAAGTDNKESDFDFYIVVDDNRNVADVSTEAYKAIRYLRKRPVDIVVGTKTRFDKYSNSNDTLYVEGEVARNGKLLYELN